MILQKMQTFEKTNTTKQTTLWIYCVELQKSWISLLKSSIVTFLLNSQKLIKTLSLLEGKANHVLHVFNNMYDYFEEPLP